MPAYVRHTMNGNKLKYSNENLQAALDKIESKELSIGVAAKVNIIRK